MPFVPVPQQTTQSVFPSAPGGNYQNIQATPEAFGSQVGQQEQHLGQTIENFGDFANHAVKFQMEQNEATVNSLNSTFEQQKRDIASKFYTLNGKDAMDAMNPTAAQIENQRQAMRDGMANRQQQRMFDYISRRSTDSELYRMSVHAAQQNKEWLKQTAVGSINNEVNNSAMYWNDDTQFAGSLGNIKLDAAKLATLQGIDPNSDAGKVMVQHYQGEAWQARIRSVMQTNPNVAREMFDANADQIDAQHRSIIDAQIDQKQWQFQYRQAAEEQRQIVHAEHAQKLAQQESFAMVSAEAMRGNFDGGKIADMVAAQVITPEQGVAAQNMAVTAMQGKGHSPDEWRLWVDLGSGAAGPRDIAAHVTAGNLNAETAAQMGKFWVEKQQGTLRLTDEQNWDAVSDSIGAKALSMGINLFGMDDKVHAQIISQARTEWTQRVIVNKEDSFKVAAELKQKYAPMVSDPRMLARPLLGGDIQDRAGLIRAAAALRDAVANGKILPGPAKDQAYLLNQYKALFDLQDKQQKGKPPSVQGSGDSSRVLGLEPAK